MVLPVGKKPSLMGATAAITSLLSSSSEPISVDDGVAAADVLVFDTDVAVLGLRCCHRIFLN